MTSYERIMKGSDRPASVSEIVRLSQKYRAKKLKAVPQLPDDIFTDIFAYMEPLSSQDTKMSPEQNRILYDMKYLIDFIHKTSKSMKAHIWKAKIDIALKYEKRVVATKKIDKVIESKDAEPPSSKTQDRSNEMEAMELQAEQRLARGASIAKEAAKQVLEDLVKEVEQRQTQQPCIPEDVVRQVQFIEVPEVEQRQFQRVSMSEDIVRQVQDLNQPSRLGLQMSYPMEVETEKDLAPFDLTRLETHVPPPVSRLATSILELPDLDAPVVPVLAPTEEPSLIDQGLLIRQLVAVDVNFEPRRREKRAPEFTFKTRMMCIADHVLSKRISAPPTKLRPTMEERFLDILKRKQAEDELEILLPRIKVPRANLNEFLLAVDGLERLKVIDSVSPNRDQNISGVVEKSVGHLELHVPPMAVSAAEHPRPEEMALPLQMSDFQVEPMEVPVALEVSEPQLVPENIQMPDMAPGPAQPAPSEPRGRTASKRTISESEEPVIPVKRNKLYRQLPKNINKLFSDNPKNNKVNETFLKILKELMDAFPHRVRFEFTEICPKGRPRLHAVQLFVAIIRLTLNNKISWIQEYNQPIFIELV